jgi:hypothetical protein
VPVPLIQAAEAIRAVQQRVMWKPGSAAAHLAKRKRRGHLPKEATVLDYEQIIRGVVSERRATVYVYTHEDVPYIAVVARVQTQDWLVMFGLNGLLESAYVLERPELYLTKPVFQRLGTVEEVVS